MDGNCPAVADLYMEWDFITKSWDATFFAGPYKGTSQSMCVHDLDKDHWLNLQDCKPPLVEGYFCHATVMQKRDACKELLTLWSQATALGKRAEIYGIILSTATDVPNRGGKRAWHETAVAAEDLSNACSADGAEDEAADDGNADADAGSDDDTAVAEVPEEDAVEEDNELGFVEADEASAEE
jgi:hypothetical protein